MGSTSSKPSSHNSDSKQHKLNQPALPYASIMFLSKSGAQKVQGPNLNIWNGDAKVLESIILDYSFEPKRLEHPLTKFWTSSLKQEILSLAYHAAPLDQIKTYVKKAYERRESHLCDTLVEAATEAIKNGDVTLKDEKGNVLKDAKGKIVAEGMAEKLIQLHDELYPKEIKCLDKVNLKLPIEAEEDKHAREKANVAAVNQVFDAIRLNDQKTDLEINKFKKFVKSTEPLNRIHLLFLAFNVLARRGGDLPKINDADDGLWYGLLADRFCFEAIGAGIEINLPPRMQQLLKTGLYSILNCSRIAMRELDVDGLSFHGVPGSDSKLGVNSYYDDFRLVRSAAERAGSGVHWLDAPDFKTYYEHLSRAIVNKEDLNKQLVQSHLATG